MKKQLLHKHIQLTLIALVVAVTLSSAIFPTTSQVAGQVSAYGKIRRVDTLSLMYGYVRQVFTNSDGKSLVYYLHVPHNYNSHRKYPLVLLLHGDGEKSNPRKTPAQNQLALLKQAYVRVWTANPTGSHHPNIQQHWPCFVVAPQISISQQWINVTLTKGFYAQGFYVQRREPNITLLMTIQLLAVLQHEYSAIDANRRYISGISSGGYGVWDAIERWPHYFAAAAPIAGAGDPSKAILLKHLPVWAFHGGKDRVVSVAGSRIMVAAMRTTGGKPRYTEFPGLNHNVWGDAYSLPGAPQPVTGFFDWLFSQRR